MWRRKFLTKTRPNGERKCLTAKLIVKTKKNPSLSSRPATVPSNADKSNGGSEVGPPANKLQSGFRISLNSGTKAGNTIQVSN